MKKLLTSLLLTLLIFLLTTACKQSMNTLLDDYNSNFKVYEEVIEAPCPGDPDFLPAEMLQDEYFVWDDSTLNLCAPNNCGKYSWIISDPDNDYKKVPVHHYMQSDESFFEEWEKQTFYINIPDSGLEAGKVYKLTLTVSSEGGDEYTDNAVIVIYKHLYF